MTVIIKCICGYIGPSQVGELAIRCPLCCLPATADTGFDGDESFAVDPRKSASSKAKMDVVSAAMDGTESRAFNPLEPLAAEPSQSTKPTIYRIPCPNGHIHKIQEKMLGTQMVCTKCNAAYLPKITDSQEYRQEMNRRQDEKDAKQAKLWLLWAIVAAVCIVLFFVALIVVSSNR